MDTRKHVQKKSSGNALLIIILIILVGGIVFSAWKLFGILNEYREAAMESSAMSNAFTAQRSTDDNTQSTPAPTAQADGGADEDDEPEEVIFQSVDLMCDFTVGFDAMWQTSRDVVAWINSPGTKIDYAVLHGETNETYLHANWKGNYSVAGSIFTNYQCRGDLSDFNTIIYGHNMKDGSMFHSIKSYSSQSYYEEHPYLWYVTPEADYVLYVVAGYVVETDDPVYTIPGSDSEVRDYLEDARSASDFEPDYVISGLDADTIISTAKRMVVLSTCSYEFDNARYVLVAVPLLAK